MLYDSNVSILGVSETWLTANTDQRIIEIPDYSCIRLDRNWSDNNQNIKKGGGICCYIKSNMIFSENELSDYNISSKNIEMQWLTINQPHLKKIVFCNLYRPPQGNLTEFCNTLHDTILSINAKVNVEFEVYILGDFNINYLDIL